MNTVMRDWIRRQIDTYERFARAASEKGESETVVRVYRSVAADFRNMVRRDPWLGRMEGTPSAEILGQQIFETFLAAAYETGWEKTPPEDAVSWELAPEEYRQALIQTAADILRGGMIELLVSETMHKERIETGERALKFWREFRNRKVSLKHTAEKMKRLAEGYVDD